MENNFMQIIKNEIMNLGQKNKNYHHFLEDYGFSLLIPTFDYECYYTHLIYGGGKTIAKIRKSQKALDKKYLKIFPVMYEANKDLVESYEVMAKAAGAFYAERYYGTTQPTSTLLEQPDDCRVGDLLASYDIGSTNEETKVNEAKRLLMDIVKERVLFDLIVTGGKNQSYNVSDNNKNDVRLRDAFATYGLKQILSNFLGDGTYINISLNEGLSLSEPMLGYARKLDCDVEEYYKIYQAIHGEFDDRERCHSIARVRQNSNN